MWSQSRIREFAGVDGPVAKPKLSPHASDCALERLQEDIMQAKLEARQSRVADAQRRRDFGRRSAHRDIGALRPGPGAGGMRGGPPRGGSRGRGWRRRRSCRDLKACDVGRWRRRRNPRVRRRSQRPGAARAASRGVRQGGRRGRPSGAYCEPRADHADEDRERQRASACRSAAAWRLRRRRLRGGFTAAP